jgi:hypothetical protein
MVASRAMTCASQRSVTASTRAALLGKCRYTVPWLTPSARDTSSTAVLAGPVPTQHRLGGVEDRVACQRCHGALWH